MPLIILRGYLAPLPVRGYHQDKCACVSLKWNRTLLRSIADTKAVKNKNYLVPEAFGYIPTKFIMLKLNKLNMLKHSSR